MSNAKTRSDVEFFTKDQKKLIESSLHGAPEFEIERFLITCERTGLDPFSRQIYGHIQNRKQKKPGSRDQYEYIKAVTIITSIDGFRAIAERSGGYRGQTPPEWYYLDEQGHSGWHDVFITARDKSGNPLRTPEACRVGVMRENFVAPCYGVANFDSFAKFYKEEGNHGWVLDTFWKKMPEHMIAKVAEAQAIRKAFPLLACGLFVEEEVGKGDDEETAMPGREPDKLPDGMQWVEGHSPEARAAAAKGAAPSVTPPAEKPAPEPKKPKAAKAPVEPPPVEEEDGEQEEEPGEEGDDAWKNYQISQITIAKFVGKRLADLSFDDIKGLKEGWCDKYAEKIKTNPAKVIESGMILAAYNAQKP